MIKPTAILVFVLFASCNDGSQETGSTEVIGQKEVQLLAFSDIIPNNMADSNKVVIIDLLVREIENDTSLTLKTGDTSAPEVSAYFKDDKLVKIITGTGSHPTENAPYEMDFDRNTYYFFMDELVRYSYECNRNQQTGRCNPVSASSRFYFYNDKIISQHHNINIPHPYEVCGCNDLSNNEIPRPQTLDNIIAEDVTRLKQMIGYNPTP